MKQLSMRRRLGALLTAALIASALAMGGLATQEAHADQSRETSSATTERIDLSQATVASIPATTYTGYAQSPAITLALGGKTLVEGVDYTLTYQSNTNAGTARVTATGIGAYQGIATGSFTIKPASISSAKAVTKTFTYTGKTPKVKVTVKALGKTIASKVSKSNANVKLTIPASAKKVGTHTITVQGAGNYTGTKTFTVKVNPKKAAISSAKATSKSAFTVKWKKPKNDISGYEVRYSKNKSMDGATVKRVGKATGSKKISGLKASTKYYVQVRAYKNVDGKKYVSNWSAKKSVKTKAAPKPKATGGTVYITDTGEKYHRATCRYLRYSKYSISKSEAQSLGYTACKVCRP